VTTNARRVEDRFYVAREIDLVDGGRRQERFVNICSGRRPQRGQRKEQQPANAGEVGNRLNALKPSIKNGAMAFQ
jgi:hypothetical protein